MLVGDLSCVVDELTRYKARTELKLVEDLSAETLGLAVGGNRLTTRRKLDDRIVVGVLIVDRLCRAACGRDDLSRHLSFAVVNITNRVNNGLGGYDLAGKRDIRLGCAKKSSFFVCIIILLQSRHVKASDDIPLSATGIEKPCRNINKQSAADDYDVGLRPTMLLSAPMD